MTHIFKTVVIPKLFDMTIPINWVNLLVINVQRSQNSIKFKVLKSDLKGLRDMWMCFFLRKFNIAH